MTDSTNEQRPQFLDSLGKLCKQGKDISNYLFQVPDDEGEREKLGRILDEILADDTVASRNEFPKLCNDLKEVLEQEASPKNAEMLQAGFDRMTRLWQAARSGMY